MKKRYLPLVLALCLGLLGGCGEQEDVENLPPSEPILYNGVIQPVEETLEPAPATTRVRIIDGAETGTLILSGDGGGAAMVYTLTVGDLPILGGEELKDGMMVEVGSGCVILETYPAQWAQPMSITVLDEPVSDLSGLYLQVLEDLWTVDPGLNDDIKQLGVDFSELEGLTDSEKAGLAYAFGMLHNMMPIMGTWKELKEQGYFTGVDPEADGLPAWKDGCLFSIQGNTEEFTAQKWRTALGAYLFCQCSARQTDEGWTYEIGSEMIS